MQKPEDVLKIGDKVMAKVINISPIERKIGLSIREYERDLDQQALGEQAQASGRVIDVDAAIRGSVPSSMIQAGRTLEDVAHEMMIAVSRGEAAARAAEAEKAAEAEAAPAEEAEKESAE